VFLSGKVRDKLKAVCSFMVNGISVFFPPTLGK